MTLGSWLLAIGCQFFIKSQKFSQSTTLSRIATIVASEVLIVLSVTSG
jgi:hypothetical protein